MNYLFKYGLKSYRKIRMNASLGIRLRLQDEGNKWASYTSSSFIIPNQRVSLHNFTSTPDFFPSEYEMMIYT